MKKGWDWQRDPQEEVRTYSTWVEGLVSEHDAGTYTMVYHCKGTCICSLTNRCTRVWHKLLPCMQLADIYT